MDTSFQSAYTYFKKLDALRTGPKWYYHTFEVKGDRVVEEDQADKEAVGDRVVEGAQGQKEKKFMTETLELWYRDPVECIAELLSNPSFKGSIAYSPERVYADMAGKKHIYDEMWTADWWWDLQVSLRT
jgi:hypothetical protein